MLLEGKIGRPRRSLGVCKCLENIVVERAWYPIGRLDPLIGSGEVIGGEINPSETIGGND